MRSIILFAALTVLSGPSLAADPSKCKLLAIAEWPVRLERNLPVIEGTIDGKKVGILLDTGAFASAVTKSSAEKLGLLTKATAEFATGFGGESRILNTRIGELRIGDAVRTNMRVRVVGERPIAGVDFILGDDFFRNIELEFDYSKGVIRLFRAEDCRNAALGYWDPNAFQVPLEPENKIVIPVKVNGHDARALLDSGAAGSVVSLPFAARLGITPQSPGVSPAGCSAGIGSDLVHAWVAPFQSLEIGGERIRDPNLRIEDFSGGLANTRFAPPEVILGTDFLRAHRVLVARGQEKIYFSYTGGLVFPATPSLACEERGKSAAERLAEYDDVLSKTPEDTTALTRRARARSSQGDNEGAAADLDAALRLQPNDAPALATRARVNVARGRYDAALADMDAAIANGMRNGDAYVFRARIRSRQGDLAGAIAGFDEALKVQPTHRDALRSRALHHYLAENYEAADRDYAALLEVQHIAHDAVWLQLARARRGRDARSALERELAALKDGEWPAPILAFYLGRLDREALLAAAERSNEKERKVNVCEARYYAAQRLLVDGAHAEAQPLLERVAAECPRTQAEYWAAVIQRAPKRP